MAIFGGDWLNDYDSMKRYESGMKPFRDNNEYDIIEEYEHGIKHFQD